MALQIEALVDSSNSNVISVFIDYKNLEKGIRDFNPHQHFDFTYIFLYLKLFGGKILTINAYADWDYYKIAGQNLKKFGVNLINVPPLFNKFNRKKDLVDVRMAIDIQEILDLNPENNIFIILSGDADFIPIIKKIKKCPEKFVFLISEKYSLSSSFYGIVDKILYYQDLVKFLDFKSR